MGHRTAQLSPYRVQLASLMFYFCDYLAKKNVITFIFQSNSFPHLFQLNGPEFETFVYPCCHPFRIM